VQIVLETLVTIALIDSTIPSSLEWGRMLEAYERYRTAMDIAAAVEGLQKHRQLLHDVEMARTLFRESLNALQALPGFKFEDYFDTHYAACQRHLLHIKKTVAGLEQLILTHAVRRLRPSQLPFSLLRRVRQIMATHPAIAPPQFV
jgi:hypothetical protein